jgi:quercetin dioxygenase-like cupin family protein
MAIPHAQPGDVISVQPLGAALSDHGTQTLVKTDRMEIIRLVLPRDKEIATHTAPGPLIVQCLEGRVTFTTMGRDLQIESGQLLHLPAHEPHSVTAQEASSLLLTILLPMK